MRSLPKRWTLPAGHGLLDLLIVAAGLWHASLAPSDLIRVALNQGSVDMEPPVPGFLLLCSGALPAGYAASRVRDGGRPLLGPSDPLWLLIYEGIAFPFWFLLGGWIDLGRSRLERPMYYYLIARFCVAVLFAFWRTELGALVQFLFWLCLAGYAVVCGLLRLTRGFAGARELT